MPVAYRANVVFEVQPDDMCKMVFVEGGQLAFGGGVNAQLVDAGLWATGKFIAELFWHQENAFGAFAEQALEFRLFKHAALPLGIISLDASRFLQ